MPNEHDLVELLDGEIDIVITKAHKSGLNYWQVLRSFLQRCVGLQLQAEAEYRLKGGQ